jgi:hypothetical protein
MLLPEVLWQNVLPNWCRLLLNHTCLQFWILWATDEQENVLLNLVAAMKLQ